MTKGFKQKENKYYKVYRDVPLNVNNSNIYFLKEFLNLVCGIKTKKLSMNELKQIFLDKVEGSYEDIPEIEKESDDDME